MDLMTNLGRRALSLPLLFFMFRSLVQGHAILLRSVPSPNQVMEGKNIAIELHFNSRVDGQRSRLRLVSADRKEHDLAIEQPSRDSIVSHATGLASGSYILRWQVLAEDGHISQGEVPFRTN
jgi:methionine-rich copper-binding protein CopC